MITSVIASFPVLASLGMPVAGDVPMWGVMFRTGSQTSGLGPMLYEVNPSTGQSTNSHMLNVNDAVGIATHPVTGVMYGLTDQFGRINNQSGSGGKGLMFTIDSATGQCTALGRIDPSSSASDAPLAIYEGDLAFTADGTLWGVSTRVDFARLFTVDLATGRGTIVADIVPGSGIQLDLSAIAFDSAGQMWALDTRYPSQPGPAKVYRIDKTTGAILQTYQTSTTLGTVAGMAWLPTTGELLVADGDFGGTANLYRFNTKTSALELIGPTGVAVGNSNGFAGLALGAYTPPCDADLNGDGTVGAADLTILVAAWSTSKSAADLDGSGVVDAADLSILLSSWGPCPTG